jgi:hypothetical protein
MKTTLTIFLLWILIAISGTVSQAACLGATVNSFGAKGDGHTDDDCNGTERSTKKTGRTYRSESWTPA